MSMLDKSSCIATSIYRIKNYFEEIVIIHIPNVFCKSLLGGWRRRKVSKLDSSITIQKLMGPIYEERLLLDDNPLYALKVHQQIFMQIVIYYVENLVSNNIFTTLNVFCSSPLVHDLVLSCKIRLASLVTSEDGKCPNLVEISEMNISTLVSVPKYQ